MYHNQVIFISKIETVIHYKTYNARQKWENNVIITLYIKKH